MQRTITIPRERIEQLAALARITDEMSDCVCTGNPERINTFLLLVRLLADDLTELEHK